MLDSVHPVPLCARGRVLSMRGAPGSQETEGRLHVLRNKTALAAPSPVSLDTNSGCRDLDFFVFFFIAVREFKDQGLVFFLKCVSAWSSYVLSPFVSLTSQERQDVIYSTCLPWRCRDAAAVELWNCLDSTCGAALCFSSCVARNRKPCISFLPVRTNPFT